MTGTSAPAPLFACEEVSVRTRRGDAILRRASLSIAPGESLVVWGDSGAGKTTLLRLIAALLAPAEGRVSSEILRLGDVAYIPQHLGLVLEATALENVLCGALGRTGLFGRFSGEDRREAEGILLRLGVAGRAHVLARNLSGGERQRVAIGRALMQRPRIILADEPIAALDRAAAEGILALLREVSRERVAALVTVLHDERLARAHAPRVVALREGRIVFDGNPEAFFDSPQAPVATSAPEAPPSAPPAPPPGAGGSGAAARWVSFAALLAAVAAASVWIVHRSAPRWGRIFENIPDFVSRFFPPDFSMWNEHALSLAETLSMALVATFGSFLIALPLAFAAARNLVPIGAHLPARTLLNLLRAIPSLIWGLLVVSAVGLGPLAGAVALSIYSTGYLGKFLYETFESVPRHTQEALRCTGAGRWHVLKHAIVPETMPQILSHLVFMLEYNVRYGTILGVVGAGGIGFYLSAHLGTTDYPKATSALVMIFATVVLFDAVSSALRRRLHDR